MRGSIISVWRAIQTLSRFRASLTSYKLSSESSWHGAEAQKLERQGRPTFAQRLNQLVQRAEYNLQTYQYTYNSKSAFERFQQQQGVVPGGFYGGSPAGDAPRRFQAVMGMCCFWCGLDFGGLVQPVAICPRCGRFPKPPSS
jgi:hypothetical protein